MSLYKLKTITDAEFQKNSISALADKPNKVSLFGQGGLTAKALKEWFDLLPRLLAGRYNYVSDAFSGKDATKFIAIDESLKKTFPDAQSLFDFFELWAFDQAVTGGICKHIYALYLDSTDKEWKTRSLVDIINSLTFRIGVAEKTPSYDVQLESETDATSGAQSAVLVCKDKDGKETRRMRVELLVNSANLEDEAVVGSKIRNGAIGRAKLDKALVGELDALNEKIVNAGSGLAKLKPPLSATTNSRKMTLSVVNRDVPFAIKNYVYVDGNIVGSVDEGKDFDFSEFVNGRINMTLDVTAGGAGLSESDATKASWGLTNGDEDGIVYSEIHDAAAYEVTSITSLGERTVASYIEGKPVLEANGVCIGSASNPFLLDKLVFLGGLSEVSGFTNCNIEVLYLPSVEVVSGFDNNCSIQRFYSLENADANIAKSVVDLSPNNGFRRINTWCTGVGGDETFEWAYKPDDTIRVTYWKGDGNGYANIVIPDQIEGKYVNGLGKFFAYNSAYVTGIEFGEHMEQINASALRNCSKLGYIKFNVGLTDIGEHAFRYAGITELDLSMCEKLATIKGRAFGDCSKLKTIRLPSNVTSIAATAFANCKAVSAIYAPWSPGAVAGAPWGATNAQVIYEEG